MATIKSYTDIEQSRKLAEILPLESADMCYSVEDFVDEDTGDLFSVEKVSFGHPSNTEIGCWSLAALLNVIPCGQVNKMANSDKWEAVSWNNSNFEPPYYVENYDNPVDACYDLILKLNELKML